jgi:hypothetical protein
MMESMRESWTDKRLDDLNDKVDRGFERIDADLRLLRVETRTEFTTLRGEMQSGFEAVRGEMQSGFEAVRGEMKSGFERSDERFDALHRLMIRFCGLMLAALIGLIAPLIGLVATQL